MSFKHNFCNSTSGTARTERQNVCLRIESSFHIFSMLAHHPKLISFFVSKTHENLKHSETTKMTRQNSQRNLQVTNVQFFRIYSESCDRNSGEPQCTKQNFPKLFFILLQLPKVASSDALSQIITTMANCFGFACPFFE